MRMPTRRKMGIQTGSRWLTIYWGAEEDAVACNVEEGGRAIDSEPDIMWPEEWKK